RTSCHSDSTGAILVKNRCPPISKRKPLYWAVREIPPTMSSPSSTVTAWPSLARRYAAVRPAGPAPITTVRSPGWIRVTRRAAGVEPLTVPPRKVGNRGTNSGSSASVALSANLAQCVASSKPVADHLAQPPGRHEEGEQRDRAQ